MDLGGRFLFFNTIFISCNLFVFCMVQYWGEQKEYLTKRDLL